MTSVLVVVRACRWVEEQAQALVAGALTEQQRRMLRGVGVTLAVPLQEVEQQVELQGLNAHERKLLRRKHRAASSAAAPQEKEEADGSSARRTLRLRRQQRR